MRKIILSLLGVLLIIGAFFASEAIVANNQRTRPKPKKVIKTVFVEDAVNGVVPIEI